MSLILNIDTATETAHVSIARDGSLLLSRGNNSPKDHASFLQVTIKQLVQGTAISLHELDAIAVTEGPGSYTGIRVGMASAKGLCFALNKPLITLDTLTLLAASAIETVPVDQQALLCPMIDARRQEVFTAVYDQQLNNILPVCAMILNEGSFKDILDLNKLLFFGSGAQKWKLVCQHMNALFMDVIVSPLAMSKLSADRFIKKHFTNIITAEPLYGKEFQTIIKK